MYKMLALIQNENMKIYRRIRTWVMIGMIFLIMLFIAILMLSISSSPVEDMLEYMNMSIGLAGLATIFTVVIASDSVSSEFSWGTVKLLLIRPTKRWKILLSKYLASVLFALFLLVFILMMSILLGLVFFGTSDANNDGITFGSILAKYGYEFISLLLIVTFSFMISTVFRSSILAIILSLLILFFGGTISGIMIGLEQEWAKYLLFTNLDLSIYAEGGMGPYFPGMSLGFSIAILAIHFIAFHAIAFYLFKKRDISF